MSVSEFKEDCVELELFGGVFILCLLCENWDVTVLSKIEPNPATHDPHEVGHLS